MEGGTKYREWLKEKWGNWNKTGLSDREALDAALGNGPNACVRIEFAASEIGRKDLMKFAGNVEEELPGKLTAFFQDQQGLNSPFLKASILTKDEAQVKFCVAPVANSQKNDCLTSALVKSLDDFKAELAKFGQMESQEEKAALEESFSRLQGGVLAATDFMTLIYVNSILLNPAAHGYEGENASIINITVNSTQGTWTFTGRGDDLTTAARGLAEGNPGWVSVAKRVMNDEDPQIDLS